MITKKKNEKQVIFFIALTIFAASCKKNDDSVNKSLFSGSDISSQATVIADPATKEATINISKSEAWKVYAGKTTSNINFDTPLASGSAAEKKLLNNVFNVYCFEQGGSRTVLGVRQLPIEGQRNFRDLGGYKTKDGKVVKWGMVFRSGKCNLLTDSDLDYLVSASLKTVIDFRSESEKVSEPDRVPTSVIYQQALPIDAGNLGGNIDINTVLATGNIEAAKQFLVVGNQAFITSFQNEYKQFFATLQAGGNTPIMFHCTAGKDRAGLAAALFLSSLGVDRETIIQDYMLTNVCSNVTLEGIKAQYTPVMGENAAICMYYIYSVQREYIQAAFDTIEQNYGSVENFLTQQLGVDLAKMKSFYLY